MDGHWESLDRKVQNVWESIGRTGDRYVLIGGTALAWHLGHRVSFDVDLSTSGPVEHPRVIRQRWGTHIVGKHKWLRRSPDHYVKFFATSDAPKIDIHGKVQTGCLDSPIICESGLRIASLTDILKQKLVAMTARQVARDGEDVAALLEDGRADVGLAIAALKDETGTGVGLDAAVALGMTLKDLAATEWNAFPSLRALTERLLMEEDAPVRLFSDRIEGPLRLPSLDLEVDDGPCP